MGSGAGSEVAAVTFCSGLPGVVREVVGCRENMFSEEQLRSLPTCAPFPACRMHRNRQGFRRALTGVRFRHTIISREGGTRAAAASQHVSGR